MYVEEYSHGGYVNHRTKGDRKLLLQKKELKKLHKEVQNTGLTIAPLRLIITDKGFAKLRIALAKGKNFTTKEKRLKIATIKEI